MTVEENYIKLRSVVPEEVTIVCVSKTKPVEDIQKVYDVGARDFGENKVQELVAKYEVLPKDIKWHLIGHLQRNKVKYIVGKVELIHSLDSIRLLEEIEKQYAKENKIAKVLIQINIGKEESKTGIYLEDLDSLIEAVGKVSHVKVEGLMATIPKGDEISCKAYFKEMKRIFDDLSVKNLKNINMKNLSIGMSSDYNYALEEGSTMVRLGSSIFGKRDYSKI